MQERKQRTEDWNQESVRTFGAWGVRSFAMLTLRYLRCKSQMQERARSKLYIRKVPELVEGLKFTWRTSSTMAIHEIVNNKTLISRT